LKQARLRLPCVSFVNPYTGLARILLNLSFGQCIHHAMQYLAPPHTHSHSQINIFPKFSPSPFLVFSVHYGVNRKYLLLSRLQCQAKILLFCRFDKKPNLVLACLLLKSPYDCHSKVTLIHVMSLLCKHVVFDTLLPPTLVSNKLLRQILYCYSSSVDTS